MHQMSLIFNRGIGWSLAVDDQVVVAAAPSLWALLWRVLKRAPRFRRTMRLRWETTPHGATWRVERGWSETEPAPCRPGESDEGESLENSR